MTAREKIYIDAFISLKKKVDSLTSGDYIDYDEIIPGIEDHMFFGIYMNDGFNIVSKIIDEYLDLLKIKA